MDSYLEWLNRSKDETKSLDCAALNSVCYYKGFIEGSRYNLGDLFEAFGETTLKPHLIELLKFHTEVLDKYEKFETDKQSLSAAEIHGGYDYFIWLLIRNNLDLDDTTDQEPEIFWKYKGLILRTYEKLKCKNKK